jgi:hypothetical protein
VNRIEFEQLRDLPDKQISGNVTFSAKRGARPLHILDPIEVHNSLGIDLVLQGTYNSVINKLTVQFFVRGVGPICRFCVNGRVHGDCGRTHKHDLLEEDDPGRNIPNAVDRPDLANLSLPEAWGKMCDQARITHVGSFNLPSGSAN